MASQTKYHNGGCYNLKAEDDTKMSLSFYEHSYEEVQKSDFTLEPSFKIVLNRRDIAALRDDITQVLKATAIDSRKLAIEATILKKAQE